MTLTRAFKLVFWSGFAGPRSSKILASPPFYNQQRLCPTLYMPEPLHLQNMADRVW